ncbi:hypothetical protein Pla22_35120 [Rubripirellula amarantea]|uniref:Lipocalin-like domain-containing protein n=1 Tax=Rubripirellula amarantea TaxID=2527999 RepID=A0A5C5WKY5_9BACT|nr:hypothetical protein [Rubripirellula amarantea]TWT50769.1 hypothetical protein Pla22_35120 [Rubripirellula amarantea]
MASELPDELNGEWEVIECHVGGVANESNVGSKIIICDGFIRDIRMPEWPVYSYEVDDTLSPSRMKWQLVGFESSGVMKRLPMAVPSASGIYELGDDELRFCWSHPGHPFPETFCSSQDPDCHFYIYRRTKVK